MSSQQPGKVYFPDFPARRPDPTFAEGIIEASSLAGRPIQPTEWIVEGLIPRGCVVLFTGKTKLGKSLLAMQLQVCASTDQAWLGRHVAQVRSWGLYTEDPLNELRKRQYNICKYYGVEEEALEDMAYYCGYARDTVMADFSRRTDAGQPTWFYDAMLTQIRRRGAELVIIDTAARCFNGNENARPQVTAFVNLMLALVRETNGAVVLNAHPPKDDAQSYSGSTAWPSTCRALLEIKRPKGYDPDADHDPDDRRILRPGGMNWGGNQAPLKLSWQSGVWEIDPDAPAPERREATGTHIDRLTADGRILKWLAASIANNTVFLADKTAARSIVKRALADPELRRLGGSYLSGYQDRALADGKLSRVTIKGQVRVRPADCRYADEAQGGLL